MYKLGIIVASDKGATSQRQDESGHIIKEIMSGHGFETVSHVIVPDEQDFLEKAMIDMCDNAMVDLILTTGGTGFSPRDVTPEATIAVCDKMAYGITEAMRAYSMKITPAAMLSRAVAGIRGCTLIVNLPGSPKAVKENLDCIIPALPHGLGVLKGSVSECARKDEN